MWIGGETNSAKKVQLELDFNYDNERDGFFYQYEFWTNFRPLTNFEFSIGTSYRINRDVDFWVGTGEDDFPVFGKLDNEDVDINFRGIYTFVKNLTVQWYTQFYFSVGEYDEYRKKTPLFFPSWKAFSFSEKNKFSWALFRKNKEWRALTGAVIFWLILALKMVL